MRNLSSYIKFIFVLSSPENLQCRCLLSAFCVQQTFRLSIYALERCSNEEDWVRKEVLCCFVRTAAVAYKNIIIMFHRHFAFIVFK